MASKRKSVPCVLTNEQQIMVTENILLVARVLKRSGLMGLEYDDAFQIGALGLMRAAAHYDNARGARFSTYATRCIERELDADLRARTALRRGSGDKPLSLDARSEVTGCSLSEAVPIPMEAMEEQLITREAAEAFRRVVGRRAGQGILSAQAARLHWIEGLTQKETAARMQLTAERVNQLAWDEMRRFRIYWT